MGEYVTHFRDGEYVTYWRDGRRYRRHAALRVPGHKLTMRWSGEYGVESSSTGECVCGWTESGSSQDVVQQEYRHHLRDAQLRAALTALDGFLVCYTTSASDR